MPKIEIKDKAASGLLAIGLTDILNIIGDEGNGLYWAILDLEARGDLASLGTSMLDLEQKIAVAPQGLIVNWDKLNAFAHAFDEVINGIFLGVKKTSYVPKLEPHVDLYSQSEFVIEAIDSSLWSVFSKDEKVIQQLQAKFHDIKLIEM